MEFLKGFAIGVFVGTFLGVLILGIMQLIRRGDDLYEKLILEQGREVSTGVVCEPFDHFEHFNPHRDRRVCPERRGQSGETGNIDYRLLHHVNGHLGVQKGPRG
jgi:hypothetical protein